MSVDDWWFRDDDGLLHARRFTYLSKKESSSMFSNANFLVIEYEQRNEGLQVAYESSRRRPMCLSDASRFAAALSYAKGAHVQVLPVTSGETYMEWWFAGRHDSEPRIKITSGA